MKINVKALVDPKAILARKGLGPDNRLRKYLAGRVKAHCDPYVPMKAGILKNTAAISPDGSELTYSTPYAHYQYVGEVYGPNVLTKRGWRSMAKKGCKTPTGRKLQHKGAPMRGPHWEKRMVADRRGVIEDEIAAFINQNGG